MMTQEKNKLKSSMILRMLIIVVGLPSAIYLSRHSSLVYVKITSSIIAFALFISLGFFMHHVIEKLGELERAIQLQIYSYSYLGFLTFLGIFMVLQQTFNFRIDAGDAIVIILFSVSLIQLLTTILIKKKYR